MLVKFVGKDSIRIGRVVIFMYLVIHPCIVGTEQLTMEASRIVLAVTLTIRSRRLFNAGTVPRVRGLCSLNAAEVQP